MAIQLYLSVVPFQSQNLMISFNLQDFICTCKFTCVYTCFNERKKEASKVKQAKQHSTLKAVTFPKKNELPRVGFEPTTLYTLDRALYH